MKPHEIDDAEAIGWHVIARGGDMTARVHPGMCLGETRLGELSFEPDDAVVVFHRDDDGLTLEVVSDDHELLIPPRRRIRSFHVKPKTQVELGFLEHGLYIDNDLAIANPPEDTIRIAVVRVGEQAADWAALGPMSAGHHGLATQSGLPVDFLRREHALATAAKRRLPATWNAAKGLRTPLAGAIVVVLAIGLVAVLTQMQVGTGPVDTIEAPESQVAPVPVQSDGDLVNSDVLARFSVLLEADPLPDKASIDFAVESLKSLQAAYPADPRVPEALGRLTERLVAEARRSYDNGDPLQAGRLMEQATAIGVAQDKVDATMAYFAAAALGIASVDDAAPASAPPVQAAAEEPPVATTDTEADPVDATVDAEPSTEVAEPSTEVAEPSTEAGDSPTELAAGSAEDDDVAENVSEAVVPAIAAAVTAAAVAGELTEESAATDSPSSGETAVGTEVETESVEAPAEVAEPPTEQAETPAEVADAPAEDVDDAEPAAEVATTAPGAESEAQAPRPDEPQAASDSRPAVEDAALGTGAAALGAGAIALGAETEAPGIEERPADDAAPAIDSSNAASAAEDPVQPPEDFILDEPATLEEVLATGTADPEILVEDGAVPREADIGAGDDDDLVERRFALGEFTVGAVTVAPSPDGSLPDVLDDAAANTSFYEESGLPADGTAEEPVQGIAYVPSQREPLGSDGLSPNQVPPDEAGLAAPEGVVEDRLYPFSDLTVTRMVPLEYPGRVPPGIDGTVDLEFTVSESGRVSDLEVKGKAAGFFIRAAERTVKQWRFEPVVKDGKVVPVRTALRVTFRG
jgi:TonB family protein